jgi:hypothetical protein
LCVILDVEVLGHGTEEDGHDRLRSGLVEPVVAGVDLLVIFVIELLKQKT